METFFFTQGDIHLKPQYQYIQCPVIYTPPPLVYYFITPVQMPIPSTDQEVSTSNSSTVVPKPQEEINYTVDRTDNKKRYRCGYENCSKSYKSKENLILHYKNKHLCLKPYQCDYCSMSFSHRNGKTYHERKVHTLVFPHKCSFPGCEMKFASKSALTYHTKHQHNS